jgi:hypothetical protein
VVADADGDAELVERLPDVVRVHPGDVEADGRAAHLGGVGADDADARRAVRSPSSSRPVSTRSWAVIASGRRRRGKSHAAASRPPG